MLIDNAATNVKWFYHTAKMMQTTLDYSSGSTTAHSYQLQITILTGIIQSTNVKYNNISSSNALFRSEE